MFFFVQEMGSEGQRWLVDDYEQNSDSAEPNSQTRHRYWPRLHPQVSPSEGQLHILDFIRGSMRVRFDDVDLTVAAHTVSRQNTIGIYIIPLALIQHTAQKQNIICDNQLLKLQPAVTNKMLYSTTGC